MYTIDRISNGAQALAGVTIFWRDAGFSEARDHLKEVTIRGFGVGLLALATFAAAGIFLRRRRYVPVRIRGGRKQPTVDKLYAAGM